MHRSVLTRALVFLAWGAQLAALSVSQPCEMDAHGVSAHTAAHAAAHAMPDAEAPTDTPHAPCQCMLVCCVVGPTLLPSPTTPVAAVVRLRFESTRDAPTASQAPRSAVRRLPWAQGPPRTA